MEKHFNRTQRCLLSVYLLKIVLELFTQTFLTSHILSVTPNNVLGQGLMNIGLLYIAQNVTYVITYFILSFFVDKSNRVSFLRIGIFVNMLLLVALVFWGEVISHWVILAGVICGLDSFFYASYYVMKTELNGRSSVKKYNIGATVFTNLIRVVVPTVLGFVIDASSYSAVAIYVVLIAVAQFAISFGIKSNRPPHSKFEVKKYLKYLKDNKPERKKIKYTYINAMLAGFKSTYKTIVIILTVYTFKTNVSLGLFTSAFSLVTMLLLMLFKRYDNNPKLNKPFVYGFIGLVPFLSCIALAIKLNVTTLIIFNFTLILTSYFSDYFGSCERDAIIKHLGQYEFIAEHNMLIENIQAGFKVVAYVVFVLVGLLADILAFKILLLVYAAINPIKYFVMYTQRLIRKEYEHLAEEKTQNEEIIAENN